MKHSLIIQILWAILLILTILIVYTAYQNYKIYGHFFVKNQNYYDLFENK